MNNGIIISKHVINTIQALPPNEREAISKALACEFILGQEPCESLTPIQGILYSMIRYYVKKDMSGCSVIAGIDAV